MGKRSCFERIPRDFYPTPAAAVRPLLPHLRAPATFIEPCAGDGTLIRHLENGGRIICVGAYDIAPQRGSSHHLIVTKDARDYAYPGRADYFITNPPWDRHLLHPIIENLSRQLPTWLLFDADWMHTRQSAPFMPFLRKIVSVGRVKWIADSPFTGKDNCCWYLFDQTSEAPALFIGRAA
jgi:hypothetical protein